MNLEQDDFTRDDLSNYVAELLQQAGVEAENINGQYLTRDAQVSIPVKGGQLILTIQADADHYRGR